MTTILYKYIKMFKFTNKGFTIIIIFLFLGLIIIPNISGVYQRGLPIPITKDMEKDLDLLHGEIAFYIKALGDSNPFNITCSIPPNYKDQAPALFEIREDTTAEIVSYRAMNDTKPPNKIINFTIGSMQKDETTFLHFDYWVIVKSSDFSGLPQYVKIPTEKELPNETKKWLASTNAIQSKNLFIKLKSCILKCRNNNLIVLGQKIVDYTCNHYDLELIWFFANVFSPKRERLLGKCQDAVSTLYVGGCCVGDANLGSALFRANGVPARNLLVMPSWPWYYTWYNMHYMCEYYCPGYGWIPAETSLGIVPYQLKNHILLRIVYPDEENEAGKRFDYFGGWEQWYWTDTEKTWIYWDWDGSGTRSRMEANVTTDETIMNIAFNLTQDVYELHTRFLGINLTKENAVCFNNAISAQQNAIQCFNQSNIYGYYDNMIIAYNEYIKIECPNNGC